MQGGSELAHSCQRSCTSVLWHWFAAGAFVLFCVYLSALAIHFGGVELAGVTSIPPGLLHHEKRH